MNEQPDENTITKLLEDLYNTEGYLRRIAIDKIAEIEIKDERIVKALIKIAGDDPNNYIRGFARNALSKLGIEFELPEVDMSVGGNSPEPVSIPEPVTDLRGFLRRYSQQIMGFIGWYLIATVLSGPNLLGLITTPITLMALIGFARSKESKGLAGGILIAISLNFVVSLVRGVALNAWCLVPFYNGIN